MLRFALIVIAAAVTAGCAEYPSQVDDDFGMAVTRARALQTIDPDAPSRQRPVLGTDGQAAKASVDRYEKSFETPPPPVNVYSIGVGSGTGSTGTSAR